MPTWPFAIAALFAVIPYAYVVLVGRRGPLKWALFVPAVTITMVAPFFGPEIPVYRLLVAMAGFLLTMRLIEVATGRVSNPAMLASFPRFWLLFTNATDPHLPTSQRERQSARREGLWRLARAALMAMGVVVMVAITTYFPAVHDSFFSHMFWVVWAFYFFAGAIFAAATGVGAVVSGIRFEEVLNAPPLATSPRDFWSRRWNMAFRNIAHRLIFTPITGGKKRRVTLAVVIVFLFSGVIHEYLVFVVFGESGGHMMAFFSLHGLATLADGWVRRRRNGRPLLPRPLAIACHMAWMTVSCWFFFVPILEMIPLHTFTLADLGTAALYGL